MKIEAKSMTNNMIDNTLLGIEMWRFRRHKSNGQISLKYSEVQRDCIKISLESGHHINRNKKCYNECHTNLA